MTSDGCLCCCPQNGAQYFSKIISSFLDVAFSFVRLAKGYSNRRSSLLGATKTLESSLFGKYYFNNKALWLHERQHLLLTAGVSLGMFAAYLRAKHSYTRPAAGIKAVLSLAVFYQADPVCAVYLDAAPYLVDRA
jgi:hypothetical protein